MNTKTRGQSGHFTHSVGVAFSVAWRLVKAFIDVHCLPVLATWWRGAIALAVAIGVWRASGTNPHATVQHRDP